MNYMTHWLMYDQIIFPKGKVWKQFGPLYVHIPSKEFIFALKIVAGRDKDIEDLHTLHRETKIKTRQQAQKLLDRYILPAKQEVNASEIAKSFKVLF